MSRPIAAATAAVTLGVALWCPPRGAGQTPAPLVEPAPPFEPPPVEVLAARRERLLDAIGSGVVVINSSGVKDIERDYPQDSDFRQSNDFMYLTGLETPDAWLLLVAGPDGRRTETLFIPERNPGQEQWTGQRATFGEAEERSGVATARATGEFEDALPPALFALARESTDAALYAPLNHLTRDNEVIAGLLFESPFEVRDVEPVVARLRLVKDDYELRMLQRAIDLTAAAQRAAMRIARPGMYEYELEAVIEYTFRAGGAERVGFPSIVGSGPNSVVLHYDKSRRRMEAGDLVVMDIGAEYSYYTADVTRTIPVSGVFTPRQRVIYELVRGAQQAGIDAVAPGATMRDVNAAAREYLTTHSGDACGGKSCAAYFIHGVGHWLGMDVHDVGAYATPFEPGMVLTVEPGIYLAEESLGVRIEDDVLVTETGSRVLSSAAPRHPDEIEALMGEGSATR